MYIRRKVFSVGLDEYGNERLYSQTELISEEDYLNELMYSDEEEAPRKSHKGRNIALGAAGAAALATTAGILAHKGKLGPKAQKYVDNAYAKARGVFRKKGGKVVAAAPASTPARPHSTLLPADYMGE
jgi:hypothetical protein